MPKTIQELKQEFEKHLRARDCEKPSKEMLLEFFAEGYKLGYNSAEKDSQPLHQEKQNESTKPDSAKPSKKT